MAKVISLEEKRLLKAMQTDLNASIARISELTRELPEIDNTIGSYPSVNEWLGNVISQEILRRNQLSEEIFLCGVYISAMLAKADADLKSYAVDFLEQWSNSSDPKFLKMGGDFCFILCGAFSARCERRMMTLQDYQDLGASFYEWFYASTGKVIGHYMSSNFLLMQEIVRSILPARSTG